MQKQNFKKYQIFFTAVIAVILYCCSFQANLFAQKKYSLEECINATIANNFDIIYSQQQAIYAEKQLKSAWGAYLPTVGFNAGFSHIFKQTNSSIALNSYSMSTQANLLIYDGFARESNYKIAKQEQKLNEIQHKYLIEQLKLNVYTQFVNIIQLKEIAKARRQDIEAGKADLEDLKGRIEAGIVPQYMLLAQEAEIGNKEIILLNTEIEINAAKQNLLTVMALDPSIDADFNESDITVNISQNEIDNFRNNIGNLANSIDLALKNRLDFSSSQLVHSNAILSKEMANSAYFPTLTANLGYSWQNSELVWKDYNQASFGLNLNVPIFNNFKTDLQVQQADLAFQQADLDLQKLEQSIRAEVQTAYFNLESSEKSLKISEKALESAAQNFELFTEKLNIGTATITDYITANSQYITAQINNISSIYAYISARRNLLFTIGNYAE